MALTNKLSAIGDAIREKTGKSEKLTLEQMPVEIASITTGSETIPFVISGKAINACAATSSTYPNLPGDFFIENYGNTITTKDITIISGMFEYSSVSIILFDINCKSETAIITTSAFNSCSNLKNIPNINGITILDNADRMFTNCYRVRYIPNDLFKDCSYTGTQYDRMFYNCYSLRKLPQYFISSFDKNLNYQYSLYYNGFYQCACLDEIVDLMPSGEYTTNTFNSTCSYCARLKNFTFKLQEDGTPYVMNWKNQTIDLASYIGHYTFTRYILNYNSGITADKEVKDDATYQALKDDPDWFTMLPAYSRYNHDSAVATINSLPDTSAYLAANGGTNTIKFTGDSGSATDGGAINTLTEEEIAVAAAKGWTVTLS